MGATPEPCPTCGGTGWLGDYQRDGCPDCGGGAYQAGTGIAPWPVTVPDTPSVAAFTCEICGSDTPWWRIERFGDAVVSWACFTHLSDVCLAMQRTGEHTQLVVREHSP